MAEYADVRHLPFEDSSYDKVLSISTIEHIDDDALALHEMLRVLKPGGLLLLTTELGLVSKPYSEDDGSFYRIYDAGQLFTLLNCPMCRVEEGLTCPHLQTEDVADITYTTVFCKIRKTRETRKI